MTAAISPASVGKGRLTALWVTTDFFVGSRLVVSRRGHPVNQKQIKTCEMQRHKSELINQSQWTINNVIARHIQINASLPVAAMSTSFTDPTSDAWVLSPCTATYYWCTCSKKSTSAVDNVTAASPNKGKGKAPATDDPIDGDEEDDQDEDDEGDEDEEDEDEEVRWTRWKLRFCWRFFSRSPMMISTLLLSSRKVVGPAAFALTIPLWRPWKRPA